MGTIDDAGCSMRRLIIEEPVARSSLWSRRFALVGLLLAALAVVVGRNGWVDPPGAVAMLAGALGIAAAALPAAGVAAVVIWRTGRPGIGPALGGMILALLLLAYPVWLTVQAAGVPAINDVTTNPGDPPSFSHVPKALAARRGINHDLPSETIRQAQASAYPDLQPLVVELGAEDAFKIAQHVLSARRWSLVDVQAPAGRPATGHIDAVARTAVMGFAEDVTVRVTALAGGQARLDIRSAARFGRNDLGTNVARVRALAADIESAADEE